MIFGSLDSGLSSIKGNIADVIDGFKTLKNYKDVTSIYEGFGINLRGLSQQDLSSLQQYVDLIRDANPSSVELNEVMANTSEAAKNQAKQFKKLAEQYHQGVISENEYRIATQNLSAAQRIATVTSKALSIALNTIVNVGFMIAVNAIIKGIEYIATAEERAAEAAKELRENATSASAEFDTENKSLNELVTRYSELVSSTDDVASIKTQLSDLQDELVKKYGEEAEALDLLNGKYEENIEKMNEFARNNAKKYLDENKIAIEEAEAALTEVAKTTFENRNGMVGYYGGLRLGSFSKEFAEELKSEYDQITVVQEGLSKDLTVFVDGDLKTRLEIAKKIRSEYGETENYSKSLYQSINNTIQETETLYEQYKQIADEAKKSRDILSDKNVLSLENASTSIGAITTTALSQLTEIQTETDAIGDKWFENLDEIQKGSLKTIDTMKSALQTIAGDGLLSSDEFWALAKIDTERVLDGAKLVGNQFKVSEEQLIQLKDTYIKKQIETIKAENADLAVKKQQTDELIRQAELEVQALGRRGLSNSAYRTEFEKANEQLRQSKQYSKEYGDSIARNNILIQQLNGSLGNTVDYQKALSDRQKKLNDEISRLNKETDNLLKAQEYVIDQRIKDNENEKKALENEKKLLEEQLDVLEQQQSELEDMIENYKSIAGVVEDELGKSIENLKKQQEAEENAVQAKIDALKKSREQQDEENSLLEKELELKEKLANLDKAKSTKVRTFSSARGWHFDVDREAVANAEEEVRAAQKSYDDAVADKAYKDQEKALEKEKDAIAKNYEVEIKAYEDYIQQYKDVLEEETVAENERLAEQILGADWREKISKRDVELLGKFRNEYRSHNNALKTLVNTELAMTKASIEAKDAEIKAKQEQIDAWNQYKTDVQQAAQDIKNANEDYMNYINSVVLPDEANNFVQREINLWNFKENYKAYMDEIASKQAELDSVADSLTNLQDIANGFDLGDLISNLERMTDQFGNALLTVDEFEKMWEDTYEKQKRMGMINSASAAYVMGSHSEGGVADYTGLAMLHGTKQKSETIFNANDSAKLYDMIHNTPNIMADMVSKAVKISRPTIANNSTTNNPIFNIQRMEINGVQNPKEFTEAFNKNIEAYWKTKLTENRVK